MKKRSDRAKAARRAQETRLLTKAAWQDFAGASRLLENGLAGFSK